MFWKRFAPISFLESVENRSVRGASSISLHQYYVIGSACDVQRIRIDSLKRKVMIMGSKLYVGNLSFDTNDQELEAAFAAHGEVTSATVVKDRDTDRSRGFGFVEFSQEADAQTAKGAMDGADLGGRALKVNEAKPQKERSSGGNGYGGGGGRSERW